VPGESAVLLLWGVLLLGLTALLLVWTDDALQLGLLGGAGLVVLACAALVRVGAHPRRRWEPAAVGIGLGLVGAGLVAGQWLLLPGIALVLLGLVLGARP
jgi:hypothetical protein